MTIKGTWISSRMYSWKLSGDLRKASWMISKVVSYNLLSTDLPSRGIDIQQLH